MPIASGDRMAFTPVFDGPCPRMTRTDRPKSPAIL
jgi:hypothetical protein